MAYTIVQRVTSVSLISDKQTRFHASLTNIHLGLQALICLLLKLETQVKHVVSWRRTGVQLTIIFDKYLSFQKKKKKKKMHFTNVSTFTWSAAGILKCLLASYTEFFFQIDLFAITSLKLRTMSLNFTLKENFMKLRQLKN